MPIFESGKKVLAVSRPDKRINKFVQGGTIKSFAMPKELSSIAPHAFDNIEGLEEIVFPRHDVVVNIDVDSGIGSEVIFYVQAHLADDYMESYPGRNIIGYLDYDGTNIPAFSGYTAAWYSDEECTIPVSTGDFVSGTRYFVKLTTI